MVDVDDSHEVKFSKEQEMKRKFDAFLESHGYSTCPDGMVNDVIDDVVLGHRRLLFRPRICYFDLREDMVHLSYPERRSECLALAEMIEKELGIQVKVTL
ncbi:hypothetical protein MUP01_12145 [Candidatus Bathyarchaeota archaeon]|nr:hypothetical protein [Candidatus Bathyarchaeota archaeon]